MKKTSLVGVFSIILVFGLFSAVSAQTEPQQLNPDQPFAPRRPGLVQILGLSKDQIQQLRAINRDLQPQVRDAQRSLREANSALDEAVYADSVSEALVQERLRSVQTAHAELIRSRTMLETSIRKILTPEQLVKFRDLRRNAKLNNANNRIAEPAKPLFNSQKRLPRKRLLQIQKRQIN